MNKARKFLLTALAVLSIGVGALGFASCEILDSLLSSSSESSSDMGESSKPETNNSSPTASSTPENPKEDETEEIESLEYTLNDDGVSYSVTGIGTCTDTDIVIPSTHEGLPVTAIGDMAFYNCGNLTNVVIPDSVTSIGKVAFLSCTSLMNVVIPDSVTSIGHYAFENCGNLQYTIQSTLKYLGNSNNPYIYLADTISLNITTATINENCKFMGSSAFQFCSELTSIMIPDSVTSIGHYAFTGCDSLTSITFADTSTWYRTDNSTNWENKTNGTQTSVTNTSTNATYFKSTYDDYYWYKL